MDAKQIEKFKRLMGGLIGTSVLEAGKDVMFLSMLYANGIAKEAIYKKTMEDFKEFSEYLVSVNLGVSVTADPESHLYNFMFLDEAKELGSAITKG